MLDVLPGSGYRLRNTDFFPEIAGASFSVEFAAQALPMAFEDRAERSTRLNLRLILITLYKHEDICEVVKIAAEN